ncbi:amidohydrolase family protein [Anaerobacterium chartisolvens]|uniref:Amidohydrolase family protein n=1 Tax=Anaerobacterium chartisolvens TaxID=1297424 RepID=A0A369BHW0_9FIRM|nr:amidohydrolase family protein [Anaerobacterium chartisolvens]RCX19264.1 amidohydrolase family protein [Anaerobacterium chartisolvens]
MNTSKRFDVHCHLFNLDYVFQEAQPMAIYYLFTSVFGEANSKTSQGRIEDIWHYLKKVFDALVVLKGDPATQYYHIQQSFKEVFSKDETICVAPLMMDIFYMFDGILNSRHCAEESPDCLNISKEEAADIILGKVKAYISGMSGKLPEAQINSYINSLENADNLNSEAEKYDFGLAFMSPGYLAQFLALNAMKLLYPKTLFPFLAFDPRRPGIMSLVNNYTGKGKPFSGIKLYTRLGYHPDNKDMKPLYDYCQKNGVPIIVHTSNGGFPPWDDWKYGDYVNPAQWKNVLKDYPDLIIDFAHFGVGGEGWQDTIISLMKTYKNVYADISCYTDTKSLLEAKSYWDNEEIVKERLMFGTDYVMTELNVELNKYFQNFLNIFGNKDMDTLMLTNPNKFLKNGD